MNESIEVTSEKKIEVISDPIQSGSYINMKKLKISMSLLLVFFAMILILKPKKESVKNEGKKYEEIVSNVESLDLPTKYSEEPSDMDLSVEAIEPVNEPYQEPSEKQYNYNNIPEVDNYALEQKRIKLQRLEQQALMARTSKISFGINAQNNTSNTNDVQTPSYTTANFNIPNNNIPSNEFRKDPNMQGIKNDFRKNVETDSNYLNSRLTSPYSPYEVKASSIIPCTLITGINTDTPAEVFAIVRENVYDTITGNYLLIPQGTKLIAKYDSNIAFGQERVLIVWQRLIFPNGNSINLENMIGADLTGQGGFEDILDNHFGSLLKGVVLSALLGGSVAYITKDDDDDNENDFMTQAGAIAGLSAIEVGNKFAEKALNRQPTIKIRSGYKFNVLVNKDIILEPYGG